MSKIGTVFKFETIRQLKKPSFWIMLLLLPLGIAAMMALLPIMNRLFYKQTNRPYLGAIVTVMIFIMMTLSASVNFIPI